MSDNDDGDEEGSRKRTRWRLSEGKSEGWSKEWGGGIDEIEKQQNTKTMVKREVARRTYGVGILAGVVVVEGCEWFCIS